MSATDTPSTAVPTNLIQSYLDNSGGRYGEDYSLEDLITVHLQQEQAFSTRDMTKFHPSAVGFCTRRLVIDMLGTYDKEAEDPDILRVFENGHSSHDRIQKWLEDMGLMVEAERELIDEELNISGSCDGVISLPGEGEFILEVKTISSKGYRYLNEPRDTHYAQLQFYMHLSGIHQGILFYECKDDQRIKEFKVLYDEKFAADLVEKTKYVNECAKKGELPPKPFAKSSFDCRYCPYRNTVCWQ